MECPIVQVKEGKLKGTIAKTGYNIDFYTFKGIPYAKPPIGDLRFAPPSPPEQWEEVRDATKDCNICAQFDYAKSCVVGDEDCLYLNVSTPKLPTKGLAPLPVMVFIHGGGFVNGDGTNDKVHGHHFLVEKDVVVVSFNYRLGVLGFLSLDHINAPGNMGLKDQVQALKWVQENISVFNGDPNNVTLFGISAGASSVEFHLLSELSEGLFHKAIAQAGSTLLPWSLNKNVKQLAYKIPKVKGVTITDEEKLYEYLRDLSVKELLESSFKATTSEKFKGHIFFGFVPTIEKPDGWDAFISESPKSLLKRGPVSKVPFISGFNTNEGLLLLSVNPAGMDNLAKEKNFYEHLPFDIDDVNKESILSKIKNTYLEKRRDQDSDSFVIDFFTDVHFAGGISYALKYIVKNQSSVYVYQFGYDGNLNYLKKKRNIDRPGTCHADDKGYLFYVDFLKNASKTDILVRDRMTEMWTNFAKYGDPTPGVNKLITTKWEPVTESGLSYLQIDDQLAMKDNLLPERRKLFDELYDKYYE